MTNTTQIKNINDMIADMLRNKKIYAIETELFIRGRKLNTYFVSQVSGNLIMLYRKLFN